MFVASVLVATTSGNELWALVVPFLVFLLRLWACWTEISKIAIAVAVIPNVDLPVINLQG